MASARRTPDPDPVDVLVIGAGLSGIAAAARVRSLHPDLSVLVVEAREHSGGTWDLFRYPGVRSDTDPFTLGYRFRPWQGERSVATGAELLGYVRATAEEYGVSGLVRYGRRVVAATWSSEQALWSVTLVPATASHDGDRDAPRGPAPEQDRASSAAETVTARWIVSATGYYDDDAPHRPHLPGEEGFAGEVVHPQQWPEDLEVAGRSVVLVGSGATAVTLLPELVRRGARVTVVQRTPSYVLPWPSRNPAATVLNPVLGPRRAAPLLRTLNAAGQQALWRVSRHCPRLTRWAFSALARYHLPAGVSVTEHFTPPYDPWDQRVCIAPDADFFRALASPLGDIRTDTIRHLEDRHVVLGSGERVPADVVITATGFDLRILGGMELSVDGTRVDPASCVSYRGAMLSGVPNLVFLMGYANAAWSLKVDLSVEWFCALLAHLRAVGADSVHAVAPPGIPTRPVLDLSSGYVRRGEHLLPRQGPWFPWRMSTDWFEDRRLMRRAPVVDRYLSFDSPPAATDARAGAGSPGPDRRPATSPVPTAPSAVQNTVPDAASVHAVPRSEDDGVPARPAAASPVLSLPGASRERTVHLSGGRFMAVSEDGPQDGAPVVLVTGLGFDLTTWPLSLVHGLVELGHRVIRVDNRDVGRSFRAAVTPPPPGQLLRGTLPQQQYTVEDMAQDVADTLHVMGVTRTDVIGFSLGGMIAQALAVHHPGLVRRLVSLCSTTGDPGVGTTAWSTAAMLMLPGARDRETYVRGRLLMSRHLAGPGYPVDTGYETLLARTHWERSLDPLHERDAMHRQIGAIRASDDRTQALASVTAPTLVIHGTHDRIVRPDGGPATAAAIPGARSVSVEGMGHQLHPLVVPRLLEPITDHLD